MIHDQMPDDMDEYGTDMRFDALDELCDLVATHTKDALTAQEPAET